MKTAVQRIIILPKDIQRITGKSYRQSARIHQQLKTSLNKPETGYISITEFCTYSGLEVEQVSSLIFG